MTGGAFSDVLHPWLAAEEPLAVGSQLCPASLLHPQQCGDTDHMDLGGNTCKPVKVMLEFNFFTA